MRKILNRFIMTRVGTPAPVGFIPEPGEGTMIVSRKKVDPYLPPAAYQVRAGPLAGSCFLYRPPRFIVRLWQAFVRPEMLQIQAVASPGQTSEVSPRITGPGGLTRPVASSIMETGRIFV